MPLAEPPDWTADCPDPLILTAYIRGQLSGAMVERVASHVAGCTRCEALLPDAAEDKDSLVQDLQRFVAGGQTPGDVGQETTESRATVSDPNARSGEAEAGLPAWLGPYELLELVERGGMGVVYKARQGPPMNRVVAVKLALGGPVPGTDAFTRFQTEIAAIARLQHDNIVRVYECGEHAGRPYFSMEYVEGGSLAQKLSGKPLPEREAASLVQTLARAVHFAHQHLVIHRDLKPGNVLIGPGGVVKLTDFGLAKLLDAEGGRTQSHVVMGTAAYMPPEQARGNTKEVGELADVYGLGTILYEALTGRPPFQAATPAEILEQVRSQEPPPPSRLRPRLSRDLEAVCQKCLARDPTDRYASAEELAEDLARWLRGEPTLARPRRWPARLWLAVRRHPIILGATLLCLAAVAGAAAVMYFADPDRRAKAIEQELAQGRAVVLIGETGGPRWSRPRVPTDPAQALTAPDGTFRVKSWGFSLQELVRDPQSESYRLNAEVRHEDSHEHGEVGLYVAHRAYSGLPSHIHQYIRLVFNDVRVPQVVQLPGRKPLDFLGQPLCFHPVLYADGGPKGPLGGSLSGWRRRCYTPAGPGRTTWRRLAVEVTPEEVRAFWEDHRPAGGLPVQKVVKETEEVLTKLGANDPGHPFVGRVRSDFVARGGLGLYVYRGSAAFRSVVIEPLQEDQTRVQHSSP
jgi:serine/threonine-protein kinase